MNQALRKKMTNKTQNIIFKFLSFMIFKIMSIAFYQADFLSLNSVISELTPSRSGGPQYPVPLLT